MTERRGGWLFFFLALIGYSCTVVVNNDTHLYEHTVQAWAWLHGSMNVDLAPFIHEKALWRGHYYTLHPPLPTLIALPFVALWGPWFPQYVLSVIVGALSVMLVYRLTKNSWLTIFFGFGTVFWYEATLGAVWGFCAVLSCLPTLMALLETERGESAMRVGCWAGIAALSRYDLIAVFPIYLLLWNLRREHAPIENTGKHSCKLHNSTTYPPNTGSVLWMLPGFFLALGIYAIHAYLKYGVPYDMGLNLWYAQESFGALAHPGLGPFSLSYLPMNIYTALFLGPQLIDHFPWIVPTPAGQALTLTSPALFLALCTPLNKKTALLWGAVILSMSGCMLVWSNGVEQFGARYWIQALPFLVLLMAEGKGLSHRAGRMLLLVSLCLTGWGLAVIRLWGWG